MLYFILYYVEQNENYIVYFIKLKIELKILILKYKK